MANIRLKFSQVVFIAMLLGIYVNPSLSRAQYSYGIISQSMGESGRASIDPIETGRLNPAGLVYLQEYYAGASYWSTSHKSGDSKNLSVTLADANHQGWFPGSFTFVNKGDKTLGVQEEQYFQGSIGARLYEGLSLGLGVHHLRGNYSGGKQNLTGGDVGLLWAPHPMLGIGLVTYNVFMTPKDKYQLSSEVPKWAIAASFSAYSLFQLRADYSRPYETFSSQRGTIAVGIESTVAKEFKVRFGGREEGRIDRSYFTAGLGWHSPRLRVDYSFQKETRNLGEITHGFDMWLHF